MSKTQLLVLSLFCLVVSCEKIDKATNPLDHALASENSKIKQVIDNLDQYEVQIKFTQINRKNDSLIFKDYDFQVDDSTYFYPASTVKFPIALLAMEKLSQLDSLHKDTRFYIEGDTVETTFAADVSKIFAVSDNQANNRLMEFLGQDAVNRSLEQKGIIPVRISHRLSTENADDITTKPVIIYLNDSTTTALDGSINTSAQPLKINKIEKGIGYITEDSLMQEPFSFALKNYYPINAQHAVLKRIIFPEAFSENERFKLNDAQRNFILEAMHTLPRKVGYDPVEYYDSYVKFFLFGDKKEDMPDHIKIYNKVGYAYGTLTDCAYLLDSKNKVEFMLTATILVNKNGIFNDNIYEYEDIGIPFLAELGREIYKFERNRKKY
ncbi:MAG: serine hydrolase [Maribacter sp.]